MYVIYIYIYVNEFEIEKVGQRVATPRAVAWHAMC